MAAVAAPRYEFVDNRNFKPGFSAYVDSTLGWYRLSSLISKTCAVAALHLKAIGHASAGAISEFGDKFKGLVSASALLQTYTEMKTFVDDMGKYITGQGDPGYRLLNKLVDQCTVMMATALYASALFTSVVPGAAASFDFAHNVLTLQMSSADVYNAQMCAQEGRDGEEVVLFTKRKNMLSAAKAVSGLLPSLVAASVAYTGFQLSAMALAVNGLVGTVFGLAGDLYGNSMERKANFYPIPIPVVA